jgi:type III secretion protein T
MTDSYLSIFFSKIFEENQEVSAFALFFLFLGRMLPIIALAPFFGAKVLPNPTKVFFAITLFVIFLPSLLLSITTPITFNILLVLYVFKELAVGFAIGFMISIPFIVVQAAGMLIDHQRGGASLMVNDPTIQNQSSPFGTLFNMVMIYIFYVIDGPFLFIDAILQSYELIPPDQFINQAFFSPKSPFWIMAIKLFNTTMTIAIQIASPALIAILMTDVFLGIANRLAPQVQITFLGMPLKSLLGIGLVCIGWQLMVAEFAREDLIWVQNVVDMLKMFKYGSGDSPIPPS